MYISGHTFRSWRDHAKLTRTQFAQEVRCSQSLVSRVERGERSLSRDMLGRWLNYYNLDKSEFQFKKETV